MFLGRGAPGKLRLLPDGRVMSNRALSKIRVRDQGWRYGVEQLQRAGAGPLAGDEPAAWLTKWLPRVTRPLYHPGNFKYAFPLDRAARRALPRSRPYPKVRAPFQSSFAVCGGSSPAIAAMGVPNEWWHQWVASSASEALIWLNTCNVASSFSAAGDSPRPARRSTCRSVVFSDSD